jgi:hypothetical protein
MAATIDLQKAPLYTADFTDSKYYTEVYGYKVELPKPPPDEEFINYGLPVDEQIFKKTYIPSTLMGWSQKAKQEFINREYHRRFNGVWIFIKGNKYYIPGVFYFFLNYWKLKSGKEVTFRITDLEFFLMWMHCVRDPNCLGLIDFKCRQIGDTEKVLCIIYEFATRYRNIKAGMQSINLEHIKKSYKRMTYAHDKMIWYMKPITKGSDNPDAMLEFTYPSAASTTKRHKEQMKKHGDASASLGSLEYAFPAVESEIQYGPADVMFTDGQTWQLWYLDEFGKAERMDPTDALGTATPAMIDQLTGFINGKAVLTSTVEEMKSGQSLKWAKRLYRDSNPAERMENGQTKNGLYRIFRSALDRAPVDRWGFAKKKEELAKIKSVIKSFMDKKDMKGLIKYKRKNPITIEDVFLSTENESTFHIENLLARQVWLDNQRVLQEVQGNFKWKDGIRDTEVIWEPNPTGRWFVSRHPKDYGLEANAKIMHIAIPRPANTWAFASAIDPYDQKTTIEEDLSFGGAVTRKKFDANFDGNKFDESGKPMNGGFDWETERVVCDYLYRWKNPEDFYEDMIMQHVYFGTEFLFERNKGGGLETYVTIRGYDGYIQEQPEFTKSKKAQGTEQKGIHATENSLSQAFELLQTETCDYCNTMHHRRYVAQLLRMNWENRGENDIGVSGGWAKVASLRVISRPRKDQDRVKARHFKSYRV